MYKFDETLYAALIRMEKKLKQQYLEEDLVKPDGILDGCSLEEPCSKCKYDNVIESLVEMEFQLQFED